MAQRDIYLKIEKISDYSTVEPDSHVSPSIQYRRDCMRATRTGLFPPTKWPHGG